MAFRVEISPEALINLDGIAEYIRTRGTFAAADKWFNGIFQAIRSLAELPYRCPVAAEARDLDSEVRVLLYGNRNRRYRIYFAVREDSGTVRVFHVRHWAMRPAESDELGDLMGDSGDDEEQIYEN